jgi:hypothetical protein
MPRSAGQWFLQIGDEVYALSSRCGLCRKPILQGPRCYLCSTGKPPRIRQAERVLKAPEPKAARVCAVCTMALRPGQELYCSRACSGVALGQTASEAYLSPARKRGRVAA